MDILHEVGERWTSPEAVDEALTTLDGLSGWWASDTRGETGLARPEGRQDRQLELTARLVGFRTCGACG